LILADVRKSFDIDGRDVQTALDAIGLNVNANTTPDDTATMYRPSGIRLGTAAITTRGFKASDMAQIAEWMKQAIDNRDNPGQLAKLKREVVKVARSHPMPASK
jgi:glycine hydroxymethyltransferase